MQCTYDAGQSCYTGQGKGNAGQGLQGRAHSVSRAGQRRPGQGTQGRAEHRAGIQGRAHSVSGDSVADLEEGDHHGMPTFACFDKTADPCTTLPSALWHFSECAC